VYFKSADGPNGRLLVAPHSLEMIGLVAAATRIVTDMNKIAPLLSQVNIRLDHHAFTQKTARLRIILGRETVEAAVMQELSRFSKVAKEGQVGISSRHMEDWAKRAFLMAAQQGVLTPYTVDQALRDLIDEGKLRPVAGDSLQNWVEAMQIVRYDFIRPYLANDVQTVTAGGGDKAKKIYQAVHRELYELNTNPNGKTVVDPGNNQTPIMFDRLTQIQKVYKEIHGIEFNFKSILRFDGAWRERMFRASRNAGPITREYDQKLLEAIQRWLLQTESQTNTILSEITHYLEGQSVDSSVEHRVATIIDDLPRYGYDRASFALAVKMMNRIEHEFQTAKSENP
jgi:predicted Ser/Thr protein kinase